MSSAQRKVLDIRKTVASRAKARIKMQPLFPEKPRRLKTRRRQQRILAFCVCIFAAAGIVGGLGGVSHLEQFAINEISVRGAQHLSPEALSASAASALDTDGEFSLFSRKNMFLYSKSAIESALSSEFPRIKNILLMRESLLAQAIVVTVEERTPFATWCSAKDECFIMDDHGFIFSAADTQVPTPYLFRGGLAPQRGAIGQYFLRGRMPMVVGLLAELEEAGFTARGATVENEKDFTAVLADGPRLLISFEMSSHEVVQNLETALEADSLRGRLEELEYIDLRFGNRVYYK